MLRRLLTPRWLAGLLVSVAAAGVMVRLALWQWGRGVVRHSLQNYSYSVEWVLFAAFALFCYGKLLSDQTPTGPTTDGEGADPTPSVVLAPPARLVAAPPDPELAAYNAYLARLNADAS